MTVRVQNTNALPFGTFSNVTVSHYRLQRGTTVYLTRAFTSAVVVGTNQVVSFPAGNLDGLYPEGHTENSGTQDMVSLYYANNIEVKLMTSATEEVSATGYSSTSTNQWSITIE